jgi:acid phosphatase type 7
LKTKHVLGGVGFAALMLVGCGMNDSGNVEATSMGDTSRPAERGSPLVALTEACGADGVLAARASSLVHREPYLQQLTPSSVMVGWLARKGSGAQTVEVTTPAGEVVTKADAKLDTSTRMTPDDQMWASISGLEPDTIYCYALQDGSGAMTERIGFRTAPDADTQRTINVLAFGDSGGGGSDQEALLSKMFDVPFELMIHTGDLAYDNGTLEQFESTVFATYAQLFRHILFAPASGNHDYETLNGAPFRDVFALPGDSKERWYSYDYGRIHFAVLDTEDSYTTQAAWLDADLAASKLPWKVVYMHRPPYSTGDHGSDMPLRKALAPVLEKHGVQLVIAGHDHDYERMTPQNGTYFLVTGGGGRGTRPVGKSDFTAFSAEVIHYVYLEVGIDELVVHAIDATGKEFDSEAIPRT